MILIAVQLGMILIFAGIVVAGAGHYTYATILRITISDLLDQVNKRKEMSLSLDRQELRLMELDDEKERITTNMEATKKTIEEMEKALEKMK